MSHVGIQSRDGAWDPLHKSTLGEWTEWLVIGQLAAARPYKGERAAQWSSLYNYTSDWQHVSLNFWEKKGEEEGGGGAAKKTKEQKED